MDVNKTMYMILKSFKYDGPGYTLLPEYFPKVFNEKCKNTWNTYASSVKNSLNVKNSRDVACCLTAFGKKYQQCIDEIYTVENAIQIFRDLMHQEISDKTKYIRKHLAAKGVLTGRSFGVSFKEKMGITNYIKATGSFTYKIKDMKEKSTITHKEEGVTVTISKNKSLVTTNFVILVEKPFVLFTKKDSESIIKNALRSLG